MNSNSRSDLPPPPARWVPARMLPPYSYVSGKHPHPTRDPLGHSYESAEPTVVLGSPEQWRQCEVYLWGIDLFNHGYYWEAHETWEAVWHAAGRQGGTATFCKALIKLAAAGVKAREGRPNGVRHHALRAEELFQSLLAQLDGENTRFMGLSLRDLIGLARWLAEHPTEVVNTRDAPVVVVMPVPLQAGSELQRPRGG